MGGAALALILPSRSHFGKIEDVYEAVAKGRADVQLLLLSSPRAQLGAASSGLEARAQVTQLDGFVWSFIDNSKKSSSRHNHIPLQIFPQY